ncbi:hypothetical protein P9112_010291 [Eukaryota sp. TZLM1-RC]
MSFFEDFSSTVRPLLDKIDQARAVLAEGNVEEIKLPSIVVIGDQSAGKSSVVEALCELKFPKAAGCCTRLPTIARLRNGNHEIPQVYLSSAEHDREPVNLERLDERLTEMTRDIAGDCKQIVDFPIYVEVHRRGLSDLTIIDLPGLTRNPVQGQDENIYEVITNMYEKYINDEEVIIANVHPATMDISTSDSLRISRKADPVGERTIGIFSQVDLAQKDIAPLITGESEDAIPLHLGYCAVVNPSEKDNKSFQEARVAERDFFKKHPSLSKLDQEILGTNALARKLTQVQNERVVELFPTIKAKVREELKKVDQQLKTLPRPKTNPDETFVFFVQCLNNAHREFLDYARTETRTKELNVTARLHEVFQEGYEYLLKQAENFLNPKIHAQLQDFVNESVGHSLSNFLSSKTFQLIFDQEFQHHFEPVIDETIEKSAEIVEKLMDHCWHSVLKDNKKALELLKDQGRELLEDIKIWVLEFAQEMIRAEQDRPYTLNHYYSETIAAKEREIREKERGQNTQAYQISSKSSPQPVKSSEKEHSIFKYQFSLYSYWKTVTKSFGDSFFKVLRYNFLTKLPERMRQLDVSREVIYQCLKDDSSLEMKRRNLEATKIRLEKVKRILSSN